MLRLELKVDTKAIEKQLADAPKQIRFAIARALTTTAQAAAADIRTAMEKAFDRPTAWTLRAFYAKPARKDDLTAWVGSREFAGKGRPAAKYLQPEIEGGTRVPKGFEKLLWAISGGQFVIPGRGAILDQYGNISRGQLTQILSRLGVMRDPKSNLSAATTARLMRSRLVTAASGNRSEYFVALSKVNGRPLGIYKLVTRGMVTPVLIFTPRPPKYGVRLPFDAIMTTSINRNWEPMTQAAIQNALATARLT